MGFPLYVNQNILCIFLSKHHFLIQLSLPYYLFAGQMIYLTLAFLNVHYILEFYLSILLDFIILMKLFLLSS